MSFPSISFFTNIPSDASLISTLHHEPFFKPITAQTYTNLKITIAVFILISITHYILLQTIIKHKQKIQLTNDQQAMKLSYQATNLLVNLILGIIGLYTIFTHEPHALSLIHPSYEPDLLQRITGYTQYSHFSSYQLAYNLWSLPIGIFYVNESPLMILHHLSVLTSSILTIFTQMSFAYASVYIYGVAELSSVPLAIMNYLKDGDIEGRREWTRKNFEMGFQVVKVVFAVWFLVLRVVVASPVICDLLRSSFLVNWTLWSMKLKFNRYINGDVHVFVGSIKTIILGFNCFMMFSLGCLQYYWAYLIVIGLARMAGGSKQAGKKKQV